MTAKTLVERLRAAGCVFAEDEAAVLIDGARDPDELEAMTARRVAGEPLEYVVGHADFCGVRVQLDPGVFIPRQRTAFLVRTAAELGGTVCLDLCCGSGALGLAFENLVPDAAVYAADVDPVAVACARRNLPDVYESDLFASVPATLQNTIDVVLANVPYVPTSQLDAMPVEARDHEPAFTHDGGPDGLDVLRRVLVDVGQWLRPGGNVVVEISDHQKPAAADAFAHASVDVRFVYSDEDETMVAIGTVRSGGAAGSGTATGSA